MQENTVLKKLEDRVQELEKQMEQLRTMMAEFQQQITAASRRYIAACPQCRTEFDLLAHHYSIGLFDNLVYVKCPKCHKPLPIEGGSGGGIRVIEK
jgi:Zn finger protein HypA/HybF involved in hydrogenase expression